MTFTEAAAQVLRLVGKPLHYKEITDVAIEKNLLSHVGKSPDVTMGARLAALVKKGDKENPLVRVRPGVFALREWDQAMIEKGLQDRTPALEKLAGQELNFADIALERKSGEAHSAPSAEGDEEEEVLAAPSEEERVRADLAAHGSELFASEDDDDVPIFGGSASPAQPAAAAAADDGERGGRGRRRRRGRGRAGEERGGDDLPAYTVSDAPAELPPEVAQEVEARVQEREERGSGDEGEERTPDERFDNDVPEPRREERFARGRDRDRDRDRGRDRDRDRDRDRGDRPGVERSGASLDDVVGKDLADAVESIVAGFDRNRGPVAVQTLVDAAARRGRYAGELSVGQGLMLGAARADNLRRGAEGKRPRFRVSGNRLALTEWQMDPELLRIERDVTSLVERYREVSRRSLLRHLQELPQRGLGELVLLLLEHCGFSELNAVRRQGSHGAEMHFSGKLKSASSEVRTAIVVRRDGREVGRERVTELRGALHHYGPAHAGWIITTGQVLSGAREEANAPGAAPVAVLDGMALAELCERYSVGVAKHHLALPLPDFDVLEGLR
ncbi:MAG TPA: HTH domain-containing protein [Polyangiaceae bacterium]|nr:HTH domain-containing protein [Polyangiaceae bacterium]